jgi:hypothetical protein
MQLKHKYRPLQAKNFTKGYHHAVVTHVLYHFCDKSLITAIYSSLKSRVVCTCTPFGDGICLLTNREMIKIATLIDLYIVSTYDCWYCFLVFNIWVSHALEMTNYYYPTLELFCFRLPNLLLTQNFVYPTLFSSVPSPAINNDRSLTFRRSAFARNVEVLLVFFR